MANKRTTLAGKRKPHGMLEEGNVEIYDRPILRNPDGSYSTTSSMSFATEEGGPEILIPTVVNGARLTEQQAKEHYYETGEHLGKFKTPEHADRYSQFLHNMQAAKVEGGKVPGLFQRLMIRRQSAKELQ